MPEIGVNKKSVLGIFKIKQEELHGFLLMLLHAFLSGLGIALAFTAINSLIVEYHAVRDLPQLYIATSSLLLLSGYIYSRLEHRFQPSAVFKGVLLFISAWAILMSFNMSVYQSLQIVMLAFCTYYLIYYLSNLEYWGAAALLFNVRQGKRLFGLLSVGESLAKISGYAITPFIITRLSIAWVFIVIAICFVGSFILFLILSNYYKEQFKVSHKHHDDDNHKKAKLTRLNISQILKIDDFRKFISIFALLSTLSYFLFHYAFLLKVEERFIDLEHVAIFFASLFSVAKLLNLILKVFFAGRLLQYLGLKYILLLLPASMFVVILTGIGLVYFGQFDKSIFIWIFTILILLDEVLRSSLYTPSYLILFQPLSKTKRLEGHTLSKGIMEPIGIGLAGVVIVLLFYFNKFDLELLSLIILIVLIFWIIAGTQVFKAYLKVLQNALKSKLLSRGSFDLSKDELSLLRNEKLNSKDVKEKFYALQLLSSSMEKQEIKQHISQLLENDNPYIIKSAISLAEEHNIDGLEDEIIPFIDHEETDLAYIATYAYARIAKEKAINLLKTKLPLVTGKKRNALIGAAIKYGGLAGAIEFGRELLDLIDSDQDENRKNGAYIIGSIANDGYFSPLIELHADPSINVRKAAIVASGEIKNKQLIPYVFQARNNKQLVRYCKDSISKYGNLATKYLESQFGKIGISDDIKLLKLLENHRSHSTTKFYLNNLSHPNFDVRNEVINILFKRAFLNKKEKNDPIKKLQAEILETIGKLVKMLEKCSSTKLESLIYNELYNIQLALLYKCLSFIHSRKAINEIINNSYIADGEYRTNAIELLENILNPKDVRNIISQIEYIFEYQCGSKTSEWSSKDSSIIASILRNANKNYSSWMVANAIRMNIDHKLDIAIHPDLQNSDILVISQEITNYNTKFQKLS